MQFTNQGVLLADVSFYQDNDLTLRKIDFNQMKAAGVVGVFCRAGQNTWLDEDFADYWKAAKTAGLYRGSYWLYDSRSTPESQAMRWKAAMGNDLPELGLWVDLEESYGGPYDGKTNWKKFIEALKKLFPGVLIGIYTSYGYWTSMPDLDDPYFAAFPLWLAWYTSNSAFVTVPKPWIFCILWQYTPKGDGALYGVESENIDLDLWNGTLESFKAYFNLSGTTPPDGGIPMNKFMKVTNAVTASLNIRTSGENLGTQNDLGAFNLLAGDVVHVIEANANNFVRFDALYRNEELMTLPPSPTEQYWALEKDSFGVWLVDTIFTPPMDTIVVSIAENGVVTTYTIMGTIVKS